MPIQTIFQIKPDPAAIRRRYEQLRSESPTLSAAGIAARIGVTEAELVAARVGCCVTRLRPEWRAILTRLGTLGPVKISTKSSLAKLAVVTRYPQTQSSERFLTFSSETADIRFSLGNVGSGFLLATPNPRTGKRERALEFFTREGHLAHRIELMPRSNVDAFEEIVEHFVARDNRMDTEAVVPMNLRNPARPALDRQAFLDGWAGLKGPADFYELLRRHHLSRVEAIEAVAGVFSKQMELPCFQAYLRGLREGARPSTVMVSNHACAHAFRGMFDDQITFEPDQKIVVWRVDRPSARGTLRSIEVFDGNGREAATFHMS